MKIITLFFIPIICFSCQKKQIEVIAKNYNEKHRPQIHFSPEENWMNDPNGMFYLDGEYHLFYQYYPDSTVWGPMHWGHAVSQDLIYWEHLPIALYPDTLGYIFSGSAVVDTENTSGFGTAENPAVIAIYTYHNIVGERAGVDNFQTQGIAYSTDRGRTWTKYANNPVLANPGIKDFRDPKVMWDKENKQWVMTLAVKDHVEFYVSDNLKSWSKSGEFGKEEGGHGGVWECPDLFKLNTPDGKSKWVLLVSNNPGAPNGGSGTQYFIGEFDGSKFVNDTPPNNSGWVDYGTDNYAGVSYSNIPEKDGRVISIGWMSNWLYAQVVPTEKWRSAMTLPRILTLDSVNGQLKLVSNLTSEFVKLRKSTIEHPDLLVFGDSVSNILQLPQGQFEMLINLERTNNQSSFELKFSNPEGEILLIGLDAKAQQYYIDRTQSGKYNFHEQFAVKHYGPRINQSKNIELRLVFDMASVELFADGGSMVMTDIFFSKSPYTSLEISALEKSIKTTQVQTFPLKSIWQ